MNRRIVKILFFITIYTAIILTNCTKAVEVDNELPNVIIIYPEHGAIISEPVIIDVDVTDNEGIKQVDFYLDSLLIKSDNEPEYNAYLNPYYYSDGNLHSISVKATDINGNESTHTEIQVTIPEDLDNFPELVQPENNQFILSGNEIHFIWNSYLDAANYRLVIARDIEFNEVIYEINIIDTTYSTILDETDQLFWRIKAFDQFDNPSNWSISRSFFCDEINNFSILYNPSNNCRITKVLQLEDGSYALLGSVTLETLQTYTTFMKVDKFGNQLLLKIFDDKSWIVSTDMVQSDDDCFILAGYMSQENSRYPLNMMIVKINDSAEVIWEKEYYANGHNKINSMIKTNDGGYALLGTIDGGNFYEHTRTIKTDAFGNMQWEYIAHGGVQTGYDIIQTDSDEIIITGSYEYSPDSFYKNLRVRKLDSDGELVWWSSFFNLSDSYIRSGFIERANNGYVIVGRKTNDLYMIDIDENGQENWINTYDLEPRDDICSISTTSDNNYILSGWTDIGWYVNQKLLLMKIDNNGNIMWNVSYQYNENQSVGYSSVQCFDGSYIVGGYTRFENNNRSMWLLKTDESGNIKSNF